MTPAPTIPADADSLTEHARETERDRGAMTHGRSGEEEGAAPDWFGDLRQNLTADWTVRER